MCVCLCVCVCVRVCGCVWVCSECVCVCLYVCTTGPRPALRQSWENALLLFSVVFAGSRWIKGAMFEGFNPKPETTAIMCRRDQIHGKDECRKVEEERSFVLQRVAADIRPESIIRLILSEFHQLQSSCVRITILWPERAIWRQPLDAATVTVVLQTDQAPQAAVHFHFNNQVNCYSHRWGGFVAQEYRSTRAGQDKCSWNMERECFHREGREMERRGKLRASHR